MSEQLNPNGNPVRVDGVTLRTPGLAGTVTAHAPASPGLRAAEKSSRELDEALSNEGVVAQKTLEITGTREVQTGGAVTTRSTAHGEPAIEIEVQEPSPGWDQMVLYVDEAGVTTWSFAPAAVPEAGVDVRGGGGTRRYLLRRHVSPEPEGAATRGVIGAVGKKIIKVLAFKVLDPVFGRVGEHFVTKWEQTKRPYRVRTFPADGYRNAAATLVDLPNWPGLATRDGERALLLIHGTFSRAHAAFGGMSRDFVEDLHRKYQGRVFAFDHPTASEDPRQNIDWLLKEIPDGTRLDLDIICHSRGGLAARVLAEQGSQLSFGLRKVHVHKTVFVAVPNAGTVLTDTEHMGDFVDAHTTIFNLFPDNGVTEGLEWVITVAKHIATATLDRLEGLQSMRPGGGFLAGLNAATANDKRYYAVASNYEPTDRGLAAFKDGVMDKVFGHENDLVVPTVGVWDQNGSTLFPINDRLVLPGDKGIHHSGYFANEEVRRRIAEWLELA
jgi:hypothetical protein